MIIIATAPHGLPTPTSSCHSQTQTKARPLSRSSLLLQVSLYVRQKADDGGAFFQLGFQLGHKSQGLYRSVVQIEDDQRRLFFPILLHALGEIFIALHKLDFHVELARGLLNFCLEKQIVDEGEDSRVVERVE